jgi:hypothetical protein
MSNKRIVNITGWAVFAISFIVYLLSVQRTGSLWDCGEFILGAYKLQVVHPPGAPLFLLIGRLFAWAGDVLSDDPAHIAFAVNILSGLCTAFAAMFIAWITMILGKLAFIGRERMADSSEIIPIAGAGLVAGLTTAFATSIWFSAVEGEVYAMSTFFTAMTFWAAIKWYNLPDKPDTDRWLLFAIFSAALSTGVHLLSLLTFPAIALFYYYKRWKNITLKGIVIAFVVGTVFLGFIQKFIIAGLPSMAKNLEIFAVNSLGLPFHSGIYLTILIVGGFLTAGILYTRKKKKGHWHFAFVALTLVIIGFSTIGMVLIRANASPPINMNSPTDVTRLVPYVNREQYGDRPLLKGPHFDAKLIGTDVEDRYGKLGDQYEIVDYKVSQEFKESDKVLFPRMGHMDAQRKRIYRQKWMDGRTGPPTMGDNIRFFVQYQMGWMYWRYFMWNFVGRQNGEQGFYPGYKSGGNWESGIKPIDQLHLYNMDALPSKMKNDKARNHYFFIPLIFGLIGLFFHLKNNPKDFLGLLALFVLTGIGLIVYANSPPNEPRERDYVFAGSIMAFSIWIGMAAIALYQFAKEKWNLKAASIIAPILVLSAPIIMGFQNFDDHTRKDLYASRDYAINFLETCQPNAIIFTYGDNDTYPLWYAQEVENIRPDVRVVNLSLIAVDWYIDLLRRKINDSPPVKLTIPSEEYRGYKRNQLFFYGQNNETREMSVQQALKFAGEKHPIPSSSGRSVESYLPAKKLFIPISRQKAIASGLITEADTLGFTPKMDLDFGDARWIQKDQLAILDIIASNFYDRPIYFAVTTQGEKMLGLKNYTQLEGLALRIIPVKSQGERGLSIYGSGRIAEDIAYDNIMNKFKWGNLDKKEQFVDRSFAPSVQAHKLLMVRTARTYMKKGQWDKALDIADKYFEVFPDFNFAYDFTIMNFVQIYVDAGEMEKAKKHVRILAKNSAENMRFLSSLDERTINALMSERSSFSSAEISVQEILRIADEMKDPAFQQEMTDLLGMYQTQRQRN